MFLYDVLASQEFAWLKRREEEWREFGGVAVDADAGWGGARLGVW